MDNKGVKKQKKSYIKECPNFLFEYNPVLQVQRIYIISSFSNSNRLYQASSSKLHLLESITLSVLLLLGCNIFNLFLQLTSLHGYKILLKGKVNDDSHK